MYTNIKTQPAIAHISKYLRDEAGRTFTHYNPESLIEAIHIVLKTILLPSEIPTRNKSRAQGWAFHPPHHGQPSSMDSMRVHSWTGGDTELDSTVDSLMTFLASGSPTHDTNEKLWNDFQEDMQNWHGLEWTCEPLATSVNFMDLTISIAGTCLSTTLYEKPQNLYLYLPPHSSHPRGIETGLIFGQVLRIRRLCSKQEDANAHIKQLFQRLCE
eukprot:CCRYP_008476-RA/>CCRYP_008476-RA protein AED:0.38 eAED:0.38 QI:0/0/0/1/0/0/2/0/213